MFVHRVVGHEVDKGYFRDKSLLCGEYLGVFGGITVGISPE